MVGSPVEVSMASKDKRPAVRSNGQSIGPTIDSDEGFSPTADPVNPQDRLFNGPVPMVSSPGMTTRRPFSEPTRPPLHYNDGTGPDERVTSRRPNTIGPLGNAAALADHHEDTPIQGTDKNKYSAGPNDGRTLNGVEIRGT